MYISKNLIKMLLKQIDNLDDQALSEAFVNSGIEVDSIIKPQPINNLTVGKILEIKKHPNADKLNICKVQLDDSTTSDIVCGATNVEINRKVIVALEGAKLPNGLEIKNRVIRDIPSNGMICAYNELTNNEYLLSKFESNKSIILLDDSAILGDKEPLKYVNLDDTIYELSIPSNRNDLNSAYSIVQEIAGYFELDININKTQEIITNSKVQLNVKLDKTLASGHAFILLKNQKIQESDWFTKGILYANNIKPVNSLLDQINILSLFTNCYCALYDYDLIENKNINISLSKGEKEFIGMNGKTYKLNDGHIIVSSDEEVLSLGGILGSDKHKVNNSTKNVLVEFINFNHINVAKTNTYYQINSNAGISFSKPISNWSFNQVISLLLKKYPKAEVLDYEFDIFKEKEITIDISEIQSFIKSFDKKDIETLKFYGFNVSENKIIVPSYRLDIENKYDIYEELIKTIKLKNIKEIPIDNNLLFCNSNNKQNFIDEIQSILKNNYFNEVHTYNLTESTSLEEFNIFNIKDTYQIINSTNKNREFFIKSLIKPLLSVYSLNASYKNELQPIYNIQKIYADNRKFTNLTFICEKDINLDILNKSKLVYNINGLRSICDEIACLLNTKFDYLLNNHENIFYSNEQLSIQWNGQLIGYIGRIKDRILNKHDLTGKNIYCCSINLEQVINNYSKEKMQVKPINYFPIIKKDISFTCDFNQLHLKELNNELSKNKTISRIEWIDFYKINESAVSYTIRIYLTNDHVYTNDEINSHLEKIYKIFDVYHCKLRTKQ